MSFDDYSWHNHLELKLRRTTGVAFQTFFSDVMECAHGSDFFRLKPQGSLGDKGCDGYLKSTGEVFACYGAQNGAAGSQAGLIGKMHDDFGKAKAELSSIMKSWTWTHNLIEGLPVDAVLAFEQLESDHPNIAFSIFGPPRFRSQFEALTIQQREAFIGPSARREDFLRLQIIELRETVNALITAVELDDAQPEQISPVSPKKLEYNDIPSSWAQMIQNGRLNAHLVTGYFQDHFDALRGEKVARIFRSKYSELKAQGLSPRDIMAELYGFVAGVDAVPAERQVAVYSLLAHLFESCDIFENPPLPEGVS